MVVHQVCYTGEGVLVRDVVEIVVILLDVVVSALVLVPVVGTVIGTQVRERCQWTHHMDKLYMLALLDVGQFGVSNQSDSRVCYCLFYLFVYFQIVYFARWRGTIDVAMKKIKESTSICEDDLLEEAEVMKWVVVVVVVVLLLFYCLFTDISHILIYSDCMALSQRNRSD